MQPFAQVRYSNTSGRHLIACRPIPAGTDILHEHPLTAVPTKRARGSCCWRCFRPLGAAPMPCGRCAAAVYCSAGCRDAHAGLHGAARLGECGRPWPLLLPVEGWLAARVVAAGQLLRERAGGSCQEPAARVVVAEVEASGQLQQERVGGAMAGGEELQRELLISLPHHRAALDTPLTDLTGGRGSAATAAARGLNAGEADEEECEQLLQRVALACLLAAIQDQVSPSAGLGAAEGEEFAVNTTPSSSSHCGSSRCGDGGRATGGSSNIAGSGSGAGQLVAFSLPAARRALVALGRVAVCGVALRPDRSGRRGDWWGLGMYPLTAAVVNHSCDPNCTIRWGGWCMCVVQGFVYARQWLARSWGHVLLVCCDGWQSFAVHLRQHGNLASPSRSSQFIPTCSVHSASSRIRVPPHIPHRARSIPLLLPSRSPSHPEPSNPHLPTPHPSFCRFDGGRLTLRVTRAASPGDELTISYGPQKGSAHTAVRRAQLRHQYGFECRCTACQQPDVEGEAAAFGLRCFDESCAGEMPAQG